MASTTQEAQVMETTTYPIYITSDGGQDRHAGDVEAESPRQALARWGEQVGFSGIIVQHGCRVTMRRAGTVLYYYTYPARDEAPKPDPRERELERFRRSVDSTHGMYYRIDTGRSGGRNARSTDATIAANVETARAILAGATNDDTHPVWSYLDSHPRFAAKWNAIERRYFGCRA